MKRNMMLWIFSCILMLTTLTERAYGAETFSITSYDIDMTVYEDNSYAVIETISVTFTEQRHGIIRSLPLKTNRGKPALISDIYVFEHKFSTEKIANNIEIKTGDPDRYAAMTEKYTIGYVYTLVDDYLGDRDELYWNLIGNDWDCTIENVTFKINMPKAFKADRLYFTHGQKGSTKHDGVDWYIDGNTIKGSLMVPLKPNDSLTIAMPLPEGYFSQAERIKSDAMPYGWLISIACAAAGTGLWMSMGRKKQIFPTVEFYPPQGLTSADAGYLIDGRVDYFDITSLIIYWADKGYLSIAEKEVKKIFGTKKVFTLTKLKDIPDDSLDYEKEMFEGMFYMGDGIRVRTDQLENRFYQVGERVKKQIKSSFEDSEETRIFKRTNTLCRILLLLAGVISTLPFSYIVMDELGTVSEAELIFKSILLSALIMAAFYFLMHILTNGKGMKKGEGFKLLFFALIFGGAVCGAFIYSLSLSGNVAKGLISLGAAGMLGFLSNSCRQRTQAGDWYLEKLTGFKEFIKAAEIDRIKLLVEENPGYFYNILPFAMVFGLTDKWAKNFDSIMKEPPGWYDTQGIQAGFSIVSFARGLDNDMKIISSDFASRNQRGDSSVSGGSSGGGSGGGGGRSW
jgi:uncharacterized membrane protein YgcG